MRATITDADGLKAQTDALGDLIGICYSACMKYRSKLGNQLFLWDAWPEYFVQLAEPEGDEDDGDIEPVRKSRRENTQHHRLRDWILMWILRRLAPYLDKNDEEIQEAAAANKFRYLSRRCVLALRQKVARSYPKDGQFNRVCVSLDQSYVASDVQDGEDTSLLANVVGPDLNLDANFDPQCLTWIVDEYRHEFDRLGVTEVLTEILRGLTLETGAATKNTAALSDVGDRQARNQIARCCEILFVNRDLPGVKKLYAALDRAGSHHGYELPEESRDGKFRGRVLSEAARDKWDGISVEGIRELNAEEAELEPGDFVLGSRVARIERQKPERRASMVDALDNDREAYYEDGVEVDRYGDEFDLGAEEVDAE
jgi:hypothetical protein